MSVFEMRNVVAGYSKEADVLHGITLCVDEQEYVALIGANGAGKSTIMKCISGVLPIKSGEIYFKGERIDTLKPYEIVSRGIVQIPEEGGTFPNLTVKENLLIACHNKETKSHAKENMEIVYDFFPILKEKANLMAGSLSGGQRKMLNVGKAIMAEPQMLLLDDISMGLAPKVVEDLYRMLRELTARLKKPVLLVEQIADIALHFAKRGHVILQGNIALSGTSEELLDSDEVKRLYIGG